MEDSHISHAMASPGKAQTPGTLPAGAYDCDFENNENNVRQSLASSPEHHTTSAFPRSPLQELSPTKQRISPVKRSPLKYRLQDETVAMDSPPDSPAQSTLRFNEGMTRAIGDMENEATSRKSSINNTTINYTALNEDMSTIHEHHDNKENTPEGDTIDIDITLGLDKTIHDDTVGDLSTISAIPTDMTKFANLRNSPTKTATTDGWTPRPNRNSIAMSTPVTGQRPLHLLSRSDTSSNEDDEATPRRARHSADSPADLMNFTGQTNILFPPPAPTPRTSRRSPSGRGAFPIRVNPTPSHRSQASVDRERATGRSPQKLFPDQQQVPATPANARNNMHSANGFGTDLLDIDLGPMATPRSIPTITPRELENLRSELQSRISGLEATLAGKEAEVSALKKSITDAEVRAGKSGEEARTERAEKEQLQTEKEELDRRAREMEDVLREVKQNAFVEEREREKLRRQAEEAERQTEECEVKILELNASLDTLRSDRVRGSPSPVKWSTEPSTPGSSSPVDVDAAVKNATETVARELHALYKSKHERKVADLKLSYEKRWVKQIDALKAELKESQEEVTRLLTERDATISGAIMPGQAEAMSRMDGQIEELRRWNEDLSAQKKVMEAELAGVRSEIDTMRRESDTLRVDLEQERVEKGELVAQVEVFLSVSAEQEREREIEREAREARERERQPVSPPRSDASGDSTQGGSGYNNNSNGYSTVQVKSPNKPRTVNGAMGVNGRPRPMSMLAKPAAGKYGSGIPAPGSGLKAPTAGTRPGVYQRGSLMDGIARMGAGGR
ncbi:hypothetical protein PMZ80_009044 [Knufia obscura]|uniref:Uncharacterized protein n=1 Tax=Knufia obscura TaxID=1635080 RepID=A0ABR0RDZ0_9EURO|nr:hypothetical protein PMZ80_009044 [Knufia obscura]